MSRQWCFQFYNESHQNAWMDLAFSQTSQNHCICIYMHIYKCSIWLFDLWPKPLAHTMAWINEQPLCSLLQVVIVDITCGQINITRRSQAGGGKSDRWRGIEEEWWWVGGSALTHCWRLDRSVVNSLSKDKQNRSSGLVECPGSCLRLCGCGLYTRLNKSALI